MGLGAEKVVTDMRVISSEKDLKKLPMGALVVNGAKIGEEWVFKKTMLGKWMLFDIEEDSLTPHYRLTSRHPEWEAEIGFDSLNLPVCLLSKTGNLEEALASLEDWRKRKAERWKTS